jgi:hypothetical protein
MAAVMAEISGTATDLASSAEKADCAMTDNATSKLVMIRVLILFQPFFVISLDEQSSISMTVMQNKFNIDTFFKFWKTL